LDLRRGTSSCQCRCRRRRSNAWVRLPWRAPCLWCPAQASLVGGAGARPDHPISGLRSVPTGGRRRATEITELFGRPACQADLRDVTVVGAAAATEYIDLGMTLAQITVLGSELNWITVIEISRLV